MDEMENGEIVAPSGIGPTRSFFPALCQRWWVPPNLNHLLTQGSQSDHRQVLWCAQSRTGFAIVISPGMLCQPAVTQRLQVNTLGGPREWVSFFPSTRRLTAVPL